ncbi:hypothetical protein [Sphingobium sp. HWE2-09]|uniref:hypothetical protein n=1 Tax=Sphingobium sp. HWE2-09 TaxID=3108390 RepID=UPI002DD10660|nr:hypothetical protein [Sphingobium sp. HWE2-09]
MFNSDDDFAFEALADALADASSLHRRGAKVADDPDLRDRLNRRADRLERLGLELGREEPDASGSLVRMIDRARLSIDRLFDDDDEAAARASQDSKSRLLQIIDSHLRNPELSAEAQDILQDVRGQITSGRPVSSEEEGLSRLPD